MIAIRDRWISSTDFRWASLAALPDDIERAVCQLMTEQSDRAYYQGALPSGWLPEISSEYPWVQFSTPTIIQDFSTSRKAFPYHAFPTAVSV